MPHVRCCKLAHEDVVVLPVVVLQIVTVILLVE